MSFLDLFERKGLFHFTRIAALVIVVSLIVGTIIGIVAVYLNWPTLGSTQVQPQEVVAWIKSGDQMRGKDQNAPSAMKQKAAPLLNLRIPPALARELTEPDAASLSGVVLLPEEARVKIRSIMGDRIKEMTPKERQAYLDEMAVAVSVADEQGLDRLEAYAGYMDIQARKAIEFEQKEKEAKQFRLYAVGAAAASLLLIALFSVVLVLLAIERNTRE